MNKTIPWNQDLDIENMETTNDQNFVENDVCKQVCLKDNPDILLNYGKLLSTNNANNIN